MKVGQMFKSFVEFSIVIKECWHSLKGVAHSFYVKS